MREIGSIHRALSMFQVDRPTVSIGATNIIYVSIPDDTSTTCTNLGLPTLPSGWAYRCVTTDNLRRIDGNGWIPVDFASMSQGSPLSHLPIDPTNTAVSSNFYVYVTDGRTWVLASLIESERHGSSAVRDGGTDFARFEAGNNLALWTTASGLVGYWSFDEGTGLTANDLSRRGNTGTLINNPTWVEGRVGRALSFDGVNDFVDVLHSENLNTVFGTNTVFTLEAWAFPRVWVGNHSAIMNKATGPFWSNVTNGMTAGPWGFECVMGSNIANNPAGGSIIVTHSPPLNNWHHIVCTADGTNLIMYVNGREVGRTAITNLNLNLRSTNTAPLVFGRVIETWSPSFNGNIDEIRAFNRALSAAEVRANFNATR